MKKLIVVVALLFLCCKSQKQSNQDVFSLNAVNADNDYYSKAILEFKVTQKILNGYSNLYFGFSKDNPEKVVIYNSISDTIERMKYLLKEGTNLKSVFFPSGEREEIILKKLEKYGIKNCVFNLPVKLNDLTSGFQFNHFYFEGSNKIALHAFGIADNQFSNKSKFIVIDYIQYKDCNCPGLPTIRYAVGLRSEFKIQGFKDSLEINKSKSLASLAASVELNKLNVNITVKTIGITGLGSKMNIPNNTTFNVDTYNDYQKIIDFIKTFKENETKETDTLYHFENESKKGSSFIVKKKSKDSLVVFVPQVIPVMDEYRTSISQSFSPIYNSLDELEDKAKLLEKNKKKHNLNSKIIANMDQVRDSMLWDEFSSIKEKRDMFRKVDFQMNNLNKYTKILSILENSMEISKSLEKDSVAVNIKNSLKIFDDKTSAIDLEILGFKFLLEKNLQEAQSSFNKAQKLYPTYHNVLEISKLLKNYTSDKMNANLWKEIYKTIYTKYSWGMNKEFKTKFNQ